MTINYRSKAETIAQIMSSPFVHVGLLCLLVGLIFNHALMMELRIVGRVGFAMDDAWIHMTMARNFVEGNGWGMEPGRTLSVSTSPTWTLLLAFSYCIFREPVLSILSLSVILSMMSVSLCYFLIVMLTERKTLGLIGGIVFVFHPTVLWGMGSGMELPLVLLTLMTTLWLYYSADELSFCRRYVMPVALSIAAMTRPELFVLIPLALIDTFYSVWLRGEKQRAFRTFLIQAAIVLVCLSPYFVFNKISSDLWFPTTYYAKTRIRGIGLSAALASRNINHIYNAVVTQPINQVFDVVRYIAESNMLMLLLLAPGALALSKGLARGAAARGAVLALAVFVLPYAMGVTAPARFLSNHASRYFVIFPALGVVLACLGLSLAIRTSRTVIVPVVCAVLLLIAPWRTTYRAFQLLVTDVDSTERMYRPIGEWINQNMEKEAVLAVNDIGVIGYYARRPMIDVMGLASPEIWPAIQRPPFQRLDVTKMREYLKSRKVDYLVLSPQYYPALTNDKKTFEPIQTWSERYPHDRLISPQVLYRCHW